MRRAKLNTRSMSCSISSTETSSGKAAMASRMSRRSASGTQDAGQKIDEGCLARAVGPDQCLARPALELEGDIAGGDDTAKALGEPAGFEDHAHRRRATASRPWRPPRKRWRPIMTKATRNRP